MSFFVEQLTFRIGGATLLRDVSLELAAHELVAVVGPNGAGKTTLIRALAGDIRPSNGTVSLDGRSLEQWPATELARRRAVMRSGSAVAFGFTTREVALMGRLPTHGGDPSDGDRDLVDALLHAVDCAGLADRVLATLSDGERQRVQLARALALVSPASGVRDPFDNDGDRFLLLDEPTSSLDPAHQHGAMRLLRHEVDGGCGVLVVLHDLNLAAAYADRIVLMKDAGVIASGAPDEMLRPDLLERVFDIAMLVVRHPASAHPLIVARPDHRPSLP